MGRVNVPNGLTPAQRKLVEAYAQSLAEPGEDTTKEKRTHIAIVLDASGSMGPVIPETINAYNSFLETMQNDIDKLGATTLTLVTFGEGQGEVKTKYREKPLMDAEKLTTKTYRPSGYTPMYDGIGQALTHLLGEKTSGDDAFLVNIFTDGMENASKEWTRAKIADRITQLTETGLWTFTFTGANVDLNRIHHDIHIPLANMLAYESTREGTQVMADSHNHATQSFAGMRGMGMTQSHSFYADSPDMHGHTTSLDPNASKINSTNPFLPEEDEELKAKKKELEERLKALQSSQ